MSQSQKSQSQRVKRVKGLHICEVAQQEEENINHYESKKT